MTTRRLAAILAADIAGFSAMMERDEEGTLKRVKAVESSVIRARLKSCNGRLVKTTGDGFLAEFGSPVEALQSALSIQSDLACLAAESRSSPIRLRIGVTMGDVLVEEDGDVYGDTVNLAARIQALAPPGGVWTSGKVFEEVSGKLDCIFEERGNQRVKNLARPVRLYSVGTSDLDGMTALVGSLQMTQTISYCRSRDGVRLAWAKVGDGPPLVKAANWMNHLKFDWESPVWHHLLEGLAREHTLIRYDARGNGLSDWNVDEVSFEAFIADLETVVDAAGLNRFALFGVSQGSAASIAYAVRHPEKVSHLILYGGFAKGWKKRSPAERERRSAMSTLIRLGWGADDPAFRQLFTSQFIPDGNKQQFDWFNELQRNTTSPECAARYYEANGNIDVSEILHLVKARTLVIHVDGDLVIPVQAARDVAGAIPGARLVELQGRNHLFLEHETASDRFFEELRSFLSE